MLGARIIALRGGAKNRGPLLLRLHGHPRPYLTPKLIVDASIGLPNNGTNHRKFSSNQVAPPQQRALTTTTKPEAERLREIEDEDGPPIEEQNRPKPPGRVDRLPEKYPDLWRYLSKQEQDDELWMDRAGPALAYRWGWGRHQGEAWKGEALRDVPSYHKDFDWAAPAMTLAALMRSPSDEWTKDEWCLARGIACNTSSRLPILTAQLLLRRDAYLGARAHKHTPLARYLEDTVSWNARMEQLRSSKGITEQDITSWLWILSCKNSDLQVERFFHSNCRKPFFLLQAMFATNQLYANPKSFMSLVQYISDNYVHRHRPESEDARQLSQSRGRDMTWWHFNGVLHRLVWHTRDSWPSAVTAVAQLVVDYINTVSDEPSKGYSSHAIRSFIFNKALQCFSWEARVRPLANMPYNWAAQRQVLGIAASFDPPLIPDKESYRSVQKVLAGLPKNKGEMKNADRIATTWPPYRQAVDGVDERRHPEEDLSRSSKAGLLAREAGYPVDQIDEGISVLAGSTFGKSPTIQTRGVPLPILSGEASILNMHREWASRIKATRNAREAWRLFQRPPHPDMRPDAQVAAQMMTKLYAQKAALTKGLRPGDIMETFPIHNGNLTTLEIARITPPTPDELYRTLFSQGLRPVGHYLHVLVENASSKKTALSYIQDGPFHGIGDVLYDFTQWDTEAGRAAIGNVDFQLVNAWIAMLCRVHSNKTHYSRHETLFTARFGCGPTAEAISLAHLCQSVRPELLRNDRKPWHTILMALAKKNILHNSRGHGTDHVVLTMDAFLRIYERTLHIQGDDSVLFLALCYMIRKTMRVATFFHGSQFERQRIPRKGRLANLLARAHQRAVQSFANLTTPVEQDSRLFPQDMTRYYMSGLTVYRYMKAMGSCGDGGEMVRVMDWILDGWRSDYFSEETKEPKQNAYQQMMQTFAYFAKVGQHLVEETEMERIQQRLEDLVEHHSCTWAWPSAHRGQGIDDTADLTLASRWADAIAKASAGEAFDEDV
ncbi:putative cytosine-specific methyltransferase [Triangularia verruculosa]|uniref:Cytosine-specific methyltransferase n=1 Tax=Triangularia verruculosa TaxID=2587418 RepID=A0AAN6X7C2_9PEZI|nr:putative cytosine-specific methyltransferase [Triangularia verruculosa]